MTAETLNLDEIRRLSDTELVATAISGRTDSFETLVSRYQRPITSYVFRIVGDYDAALDVSQEVFIKLYNSMEKYCPDYRFSTWLYKIAHNAAIDHIRRRPKNEESLEVENSVGDSSPRFSSNVCSPERDRERSEWRRGIDDAISRLPVSYRELIELRHAKELSYDEIAEITSLPLGTVKNRLFRAREMMRVELIERGINGI